MIFRRGDAAMLAALLLIPALVARAAPNGSPADVVAALDAVRQQCIAAAHATQAHERQVTALQHRIDLRGQDAAGRQRDIDGSRAEQGHFLAALTLLARNLDNPFITVAVPPADRGRGELLIRAMAEAMRAEARALAGEIDRIAALQKQIAADRHDLDATQADLTKDRDALAQAVTHRLALLRQAMPEEPAATRFAADARTLDELIKLADAAAERHDGLLVARLRKARNGDVTAATADATKPPGWRAFEPPQSALTLPAAGSVIGHFGDTGSADTPAQGIDITAVPTAVVVAPFDGRVVYAGPFRDQGLVLILQHGALYHSLLAGLGRIDAGVDQWVLAGEPVGAMPAVDKGPGRPLHFEMRRNGSPVDPQPWLAADDAGRDEQNGEHKVRQ